MILVTTAMMEQTTIAPPQAKIADTCFVGITESMIYAKIQGNSKSINDPKNLMLTPREMRPI